MKRSTTERNEMTWDDMKERQNEWIKTKKIERHDMKPNEMSEMKHNDMYT